MKTLANKNATTIQSAFRNYKQKKQVKNAMAFDFPLPSVASAPIPDLELVSRKDINRQRFKQVLDVLKKQKKEQIFDKLKEKAQFTVFAREIIKSKMKTEKTASQMRKDIIKVEAIRQKQAQINSQIAASMALEEKNSAITIQSAYRNAMAKRTKNAMAFNFPLATPDTPIQSVENVLTPSPANPLLLSQKPLDMDKIPISVMPNVKPIQRAFRKYKDKRIKEELKQLDQQEKQKIGTAATKIQKVIKGFKVRKDISNNKAINEYKQEIKDLNRDKIIETEKIQDNIDYENKQIKQNSGTMGGVLTMFNKNKQEKRKKAVEKAKNAIRIEEMKKKQLEDKIEKKKQKAKQLLQKRLTIIKNDNDVDVEKIKKEYAIKLENIYTDFQKRKEDKKARLEKKRLEEQAKRDALIAKGEELLREKEEKRKQAIEANRQKQLAENEERRRKEEEQEEKLQKEFTDITDKIISYYELLNTDRRAFVKKLSKLKDLLYKQRKHPLYPKMNKIYGKDYKVIKDKITELYDIIKQTDAAVTEEKDKERKRLEEEEIKREEYNAKRKEEEKQRKTEEQRQKKEAEDLSKKEKEEIERILEQQKQLAEKDEYAKMAYDIKTIIAKLEEINTLFDNTAKKNIQQKNIYLQRYEKNVKEYYDYKSSIPGNAWNNVYKALGKGIDEKFISGVEKEFDRNIKKFKKNIEEVSEEKQKQEEIKKVRKELMEEVRIEISKIDDEISPLYLTEYESNKGTMTSKKRIALYNKILKLYNSYLYQKKKITQNEYIGLEQTNPEWEIFPRIKQEYLNTELKEIEKMESKKSLKEYTREELDAMSMKEIEKLLIYTEDGSILAPIRGETSQQDRDIYNAWNRKYYKATKATKV